MKKNVLESIGKRTNMKSRMTAQSKVNIKAAVKAALIPSSEGYMVELTGDNSTAFIENREGPIQYKTASAAKQAVLRINSNLNPKLAPEI